MRVSMRAFVLFGIVPDLKLAEREGFEPSLQETCKPDFESGAFDHSATSPFLCAAPHLWSGKCGNYGKPAIVAFSKAVCAFCWLVSLKKLLFKANF